MAEAVTEKVLGRLVTLADTLVTGFDVVELANHLMDSCLEFLPVWSAGILLDDQRGHLRVLASSDEGMHVLELLELQNGEGPCYEAFMTGRPVTVPDLAEVEDRWPVFSPAASAQGVAAVHALPLRLRDRTIGALNLLSHTPGPLSPAQFDVARALTTMATLGILNHWTVRRQELLAEQLQTALNSRVVIEQAKGVIAERSGVDMPTAFEVLRRAARTGRTPLSEVAQEVALGRLSPAALAGPLTEEGPVNGGGEASPDGPGSPSDADRRA